MTPGPALHAQVHTRSLSRALCAMQNSGEEVLRGPVRGSWQKKNVRGAKGRLLRSSPTDINCAALPQAFHCRSCYRVLGARGQWGSTRSQARARFCAQPRATVMVPAAIRSPYMDSGGAHICSAPGTQARVPANASTVVHACTGARPGAGHCLSSGKLGRTRTDLRALWVSTAVPQRPLLRERSYCT